MLLLQLSKTERWVRAIKHDRITKKRKRERRDERNKCASKTENKLKINYASSCSDSQFQHAINIHAFAVQARVEKAKLPVARNLEAWQCACYGEVFNNKLKHAILLLLTTKIYLYRPYSTKMYEKKTKEEITLKLQYLSCILLYCIVFIASRISFFQNLWRSVQ